MTNNLNEIALQFAGSLSNRTCEFLKTDRALSSLVIETFRLGENDKRISIPVRDRFGKVVDLRLYLPSHYRKGKQPKMLSMEGGDGSPKIFPQEVGVLLKLRKKFQEESGESLENLGNLDRLYHSIVNWNTLYLVEGELDALALLSKGLLAVTNTCGAKTWNDELSDQIAEAEIPVTICMDSDEPGEVGGVQRAEALFSRDVEVSVVEWPFERASGHDITDELVQYGIDSLVRILDSANRFRDVLSLDEVQAEEVDWLFYPYIAKRKVSLIEGHPGIGKTFLILKIAASTSIGGKDLLQQEEFDPSPVLLMTAEDGIADTIKPRIEKMEADLKQILVPKDLFTLDKKGFETLKKLIERHKPKLVIIDPIMPFLDGKKDNNKASDMRPFFKQLGKLAQQFECAVIVTRHLAKSPELKGVSAGLGSIDISAAVRSILQVAEDSDSKGLKRVTHIKSNIGDKGKPFGYRLDDGRFTWVGELSEEAIEEEPGELERACAFLEDSLRDGPVSAVEMAAQAKDVGIAKSTLNRAKKKVGIRSRKVTDSGRVAQWNWSLPGSKQISSFNGLERQQDLFYEDDSLTEEST